LADISKINAVALANIAKLDAVLAANIAKVNGLVFTAAAGEFLLDTYTGAAAGYSVRRLATSATVLLRVRRDTAGGTGDDDEADVAYDSNNILSLDSAISNASVGVTATTLGQFLNVGTVNGTTYTNPDSLTVTASCYTDTWYDQSGNANDAEQATETSQPQIHDGTVNTDLITENGKPALDFDGAYMQNAASATQPNTIFHTHTWPLQDGATYALFGGIDSSNRQGMVVDSDSGVRLFASTGPWATDPMTAGDQTISSALFNGGSSTLHLNGSAVSGIGTGTEVVNGHTLGAVFNGALQADRKHQEFIMYDSDQTSNRTGIEENVNSDYLIYQPTDAPTSGLLATYTGAAAAYSVRQLSDKAVIALRIRRDSDDEETNIGWDTNGDLDTTAISDFCGTANGYVTRWWDQSTNGNHADQATDASQPQIYNGTAVITSGSLPALYSVDATFLQATQGTITDASVLAVYQLSSTDTDTYAINNNISGSRYRLRFLSGRYYLYIDGITWAGNNYSAGSRHLHSFYDNGSTVYWRTNGGDELNRAFTSSISYENITGQLANGMYFQEYIVFSSNQYSNRTGIETDINGYFSIY